MPSLFLQIDELPLTPNGKVDRAPLSQRPVERPVSDAFVRTMDEVAKLVADAFVEVLAVEGVGADDDFFELGGHSLLAMQVVSRWARRSPWTSR